MARPVAHETRLKHLLPARQAGCLYVWAKTR